MTEASDVKSEITVAKEARSEAEVISFEEKAVDGFVKEKKRRLPKKGPCEDRRQNQGKGRGR